MLRLLFEPKLLDVLILVRMPRLLEEHLSSHLEQCKSPNLPRILDVFKGEKLAYRPAAAQIS